MDSYNPFYITFSGWINIFNDLKKAKGFRNKLMCFFAAPGWKPENSNERIFKEIIIKDDKNECSDKMGGKFTAKLCDMCSYSRSAKAQPQGPDKLGIVSYTYRNSFAINFEATMDTIQSIGFNNIEFSNLFKQEPEFIRASLDKRKMYCTSYGVSKDDVFNKTDEVGRVAKTLGAEYVRLGWLPFEIAFDSGRCGEAGKRF